MKGVDVVQPTPTSSPQTSTIEFIRRLFQVLSQRRKRQLFLLFALMLVGALMEMLTLGTVVPFISLVSNSPDNNQGLVRRLLVEFISVDNNHLLPVVCVIFASTILITNALRFFILWVSTRLASAIGSDIATSSFEHSLAQPYEYHIRTNSSETISLANKIDIAVTGALFPLVVSLVSLTMCLAIAATLLVINPLGALIAGVVFATLYAIASRIVKRVMIANGQIVSSALAERVKCVQEGLGGIRDVILDGTESYYVKQFARADRHLRIALATNSLASQSPRFAVETVGIVLIVVLTYFTSKQAGGVATALPMLGALVLGAQRLLPLMQQVYYGWSSFVGNRKLCEDILSTLTLPREAEHSGSEVSSGIHFESAIELRNVEYRYSANGSPILKGVSLTIKKGSRLGLVGRTGSGKSTLVDVIMGLLPPTKGQLVVDGVPIVSSLTRMWQSKIAHVPQSIYLSDGTFLSNIALGVAPDEVDFERVKKVARIAQLSEFIEDQRSGYYGLVGERGVKLSGGQRQRLGIARALYKKAELIVLDEATSALDIETEQAIVNSIQDMGGAITLIIIAHRVDTLRFCDAIYEVTRGRLNRLQSFQVLLDRVSRLRRESPPGNLVDTRTD